VLLCWCAKGKEKKGNPLNSRQLHWKKRKLCVNTKKKKKENPEKICYIIFFPHQLPLKESKKFKLKDKIITKDNKASSL